MTFSEAVEASTDSAKANPLKPFSFGKCSMMYLILIYLNSLDVDASESRLQVITIQNLYTGESSTLACKSNSVARALLATVTQRSVMGH